MRGRLALGLVAISLAVAGCVKLATLSVKNDCAGAWIHASTAGHTLIDRLDFGDRVSVGLNGMIDRNNEVIVEIDIYRVGDNYPLGSDSRTFSIGNTSGMVEPDDQYAWDITYAPGGCPASRR